jgi:hypothetical protein
MKAILAVALAATGIAALPAGRVSGSAADFPNITLTPSQGGVGTTVRVDGSHFCVSGCPSQVSIFFSRIPVATAIAQDGTFHATFQVPGGQSYGPHDVEADQTTSNGVLAAHRIFLLTISQTTPPATVSPTPHPPSPSPKPTPSASPSTQPSDQPSPEPSASASQSANAPIEAVVPGGQGWLVAAAVLLLVGVAVAAGYLWRRRNRRP